MKFICVTEPYRHFRGILFANGRPTDVKDRATIEALENHPEFRKVGDEKEKQETKAKVLIPDECPRCHRIVKRGKVMHQKYCKA